MKEISFTTISTPCTYFNYIPISLCAGYGTAQFRIRVLNSCLKYVIFSNFVSFSANFVSCSKNSLLKQWRHGKNWDFWKLKLDRKILATRRRALLEYNIYSWNSERNKLYNYFNTKHIFKIYNSIVFTRKLAPLTSENGFLFHNWINHVPLAFSFSA